VIAGDFAFIRRFAPDSLADKAILTDDPSPEEIEDLRRRGVTTLVTMHPPLAGPDGKACPRPFVATDVLEAIVAAIQETSRQPGEAEALDFIAAAGWGPTVQHLNPRPRPKFAFVIHPLRTSLITNDARFSWARHLPPRLVELVAAQMPPIYLSKIRGIRSKATGEEAEGILIALGTTPREMMRRPPSFTYRRLIRAARMAERMGARLMGLGAFTSVVGDAGITVAEKADIGITSGNSLTVAATLEAAKRAVVLMKGGRPEHVRAVVIGATGSIGAVCARLLAQAVRDVVLIAPRAERLLALKQQIEQETPGARVIAATHPDAYIGDADLIITTTSALTGKVINVDKLKPGAVICDVARPPDVKEADAARRPDVLIVESGEIMLPGEPDFGFDIDMPPGTAYACLSETALLAMDGKYDDYTLGRNIEMDRVKEMYRLWHKHGLELAGLRSFGVYVTDEMIAEKRRLAEERRKLLGLPTEHPLVG
jgi:predicted amino acid dehydrogenase